MKAAARRLAGNLLACAAGLALALLLAEAGTRILWRSAPPAGGRPDTLPLMRVPDPSVLYRLVPGSSGIYSGTPVQINSLGLRDRDMEISRPPGVRRVLVLGDSMVFGVGVQPADSLPGQLGSLLAPAEVINGGIFGYNLEQELSLLEEIGPRLRPDVVVSCFVHNDIDNWGLGDGGAVPEIRSSRFEPPPAGAWSTRLAGLLLPDAFNADTLNLLPASGGVRGWLATHSRLYLFSYLRLRTHSWNMTSGEHVDPFVAAPTCASRDVIWEPLRRRYLRLQSISESLGASLRVVILAAPLWEGAPLRQLRSILDEEGITYLDLTPVWADRANYARNYALSWDPHPNPRANALTAELVAGFLKQTEGAEAARPDPWGAIRGRPDLAPLIAPWESRQREAAAAHENALRAQSASLPHEVDFAAAALPASGAGLLYGFWEPGAMPGQTAAGAGRWMSSRGAVLLGRSGPIAEIQIDIQTPSGAAARARSPRVAHVTVGTPPEECSLLAQDVPIDPAQSRQRLTVKVDLPAGATGGGPVEVGISADPFEATALGAGGRDPRLVSLLVLRIAAR